MEHPGVKGAGSAMQAVRIDEFLARQNPPTPYIVLDLDIVRGRYAALRRLLPAAEIYYAVKANPTPEIISALAGFDTKFDVASPGEIELCRSLGIPPERLSFGNTIKHERAISEAWAGGIDLFALDSHAEMEKLARCAPGARVFCRLLIDSKGAEWPLTRKFGCESHMAADLLADAGKLGLRPVGLSFHVGSQQTDPQQWNLAIARAAWVFRACAHKGIALEMLNLGGGLPAHYRKEVPPLERYVESIERSLSKEFGSARPQVMIEPGRYLVGDAGLLRTEVLLVSRKSAHEPERWVYVDAGIFNGLVEALDERIHYPVRTPRDGGPCGPAILAGPTCDSTDVLYRRHPYQLPLDLAIGDRIDFLSTGAYSGSLASVAFNGFSPIRTYVV